MKTCLALLLLAATLGSLHADPPAPTTASTPDAAPATPVGILILKSVAGYAAADTWFVSIHWVDRDSGYVIDKTGKKLAFVNDAIGRIIYFDSSYYEEIDHNQYWIDWRAGLQSREAVLPPIPGFWLRPEDAKRVTDEQAVLQDAMDRYPNGADLVQPLIDTLKEEEGKLASGQMLQNGTWIAVKDAAPDTVKAVGDSVERVTFTTKDGKQFQNARVTVTATGLSVLTSDGGASVAFDQLPDNLDGFPKSVKIKIADWRTKHPSDVTDIATSDATPSTGWWAWVKGTWQYVVDKTEAYFSTTPPPPAGGPAPAPASAPAPPPK